MEGNYFNLLITLLATTVVHAQRFLSVVDGQLRLNGEKVFLSGMNLAWHQYGNDFGNDQYSCCTGATLEDYLRRISDEGGNSLRLWIHCDAWATPNFDSNGFVTGSDASNSMISDLSRFLDVARQYNILVFPVLWNGATSPSKQAYVDLFWDESKLQSYIDRVLIPMVDAVKDKVALGGWSIMNEPEGMIYAGAENSNPCFDTRPLSGSGAGWAGAFIPMQNMLRFLSRQAAAIKRTDPKVLVTIGSWSERAQTNQFGYRNYYTDSCMTAAGGDPVGTIDFYQMHTYSWQGAYSSTSPLVISNSQYVLDKPNVIGEFSQVGGDGRSIETQMNWAYYQGYSGAWTWQANGGGEGSDDFATQARGLNFLRGRNDQLAGGRVDISLQ